MDWSLCHRMHSEEVRCFYGQKTNGLSLLLGAQQAKTTEIYFEVDTMVSRLLLVESSLEDKKIGCITSVPIDGYVQALMSANRLHC